MGQNIKKLSVSHGSSPTWRNKTQALGQSNSVMYHPECMFVSLEYGPPDSEQLQSKSLGLWPKANGAPLSESGSAYCQNQKPHYLHTLKT